MSSCEYLLLSASQEAQKQPIINKSTQKFLQSISIHQTLKNIYGIFWPVYMALFLQYIMPFISIAFAGYLDTDALAAVGLATSVINITAVGMGSGLTSAFDTLAPQALGAKKYRKVGVLLQIILMILMLMACLIIALWVNIDGLLKLCNEPINVAKQTRLYLIIFIPGLFALFLYRALRSYVHVQGFTKAPILTCFICVVLHTLFNYVFIFPLNLGLVGAALATTLSMICMLLALFLYIYISKLYRTTWCGFTSQSFLEWSSYMKLALTGMFALLFELAFNELTVFMLGIVGTKQLAAQAVLFQIKFSITLAPLAWGISICYLVGQALGAGNPQTASRIIKYGLVVSTLFGILFCVILIFCRHVVGRVFSNDSTVQQLISEGAIFAGVSIIFESVHFCILYAIQGIGKPQITTLSVGFGSYLIGLPICVLLTFRMKMGLTGMWIGICAGLFTQTVCETIILLCFVDLALESKTAQEKAGIKTSKNKKYGSLGNLRNGKQNQRTSEYYSYSYENVILIQSIKNSNNNNALINDEEKEFNSNNESKEEEEVENEEHEITPRLIIGKGLLFLAALLILALGVVIRLFCYTV